MGYQNKVIQLATKLIRLTSDDEVKWEIKDPPRSITSGTDDVIPLYFEAKYKDKYVAIYEERYQNFYPENETLYWSRRVVFVVLDSEDRVLWETTQHSPALTDLLDTVREKSAGIDDLLDDLLDDET